MFDGYVCATMVSTASHYKALAENVKEKISD